MVRNVRIFVCFALFLSLLAGCAGTVRQDLDVIGRAKLDAKAAKIWYLAVYTSLQQTLADPTIPESVKRTIKKKINPMMNRLKRTLISYIEAVQAAENASKIQNSPVPDTTKIVLLQMELNKMITNILNDLTYLGVGTAQINQRLYRSHDTKQLEALEKQLSEQNKAFEREIKKTERGMR